MGGSSQITVVDLDVIIRILVKERQVAFSGVGEGREEGMKGGREVRGVLRTSEGGDEQFLQGRNVHDKQMVKLEVLILGIWGAQPGKLDSRKED